MPRGKKPRFELPKDEGDGEKINFSHIADLTNSIVNGKDEIFDSNEIEEIDNDPIPLSDGATLLPEMPPPPSPEEIAAQKKADQEMREKVKVNYEKNLGRSIADEVAKRTVDNTMDDVFKKARMQEKLAKTVGESKLFEQDYINGCMILNGYRTQYNGKIPFTFKRVYEVGATPPALVQQHLHEVRMILNGQAIPQLLNNLVDKGSEFVTRAALIVNLPWLNLKDFHDRVMAAKNAGFFDDEINQLSVELMGILGASPGKRLAIKMGLILCNTLMENSPSYLADKQTAKISKMSPQAKANILKSFKDI